MGIIKLTCHPDTPPAAQFAVTAIPKRERSRITVTFVVQGDVANLAIPRPAKPYRTDGLWQTTCFEMFLRCENGSYLEFNFSPSRQWAAYCFDAYRTGQADLELEVGPSVVFVAEIDHVIETAHLSLRGCGNFDLGLSAVIEETDGTKSYWALAHPSGPPDFHHPACFAARLPAPNDA